MTPQPPPPSCSQEVGYPQYPQLKTPPSRPPNYPPNYTKSPSRPPNSPVYPPVDPQMTPPPPPQTKYVTPQFVHRFRLSYLRVISKGRGCYSIGVDSRALRP
uniref:Uncharacterized protein n=1 Tax=Meloidogyne enterolobii TaxID=390850 RepID=A0A6V7WKS7_MELEN|nr:unnamed protein product [Meloidogyne enterolobii]